jgi:hypothetical protein
VKKLLRKFNKLDEHEPLPLFYSGLSAVFSGTALTIVMTPMELVRIKQ